MNQPIANVLARLKNIKLDGITGRALCPAYDVHGPSLSIGQNADRAALLNCFCWTL